MCSIVEKGTESVETRDLRERDSRDVVMAFDIDIRTGLQFTFPQVSETQRHSFYYNHLVNYPSSSLLRIIVLARNVRLAQPDALLMWQPILRDGIRVVSEFAFEIMLVQPEFLSQEVLDRLLERPLGSLLGSKRPNGELCPDKSAFNVFLPRFPTIDQW